MPLADVIGIEIVEIASDSSPEVLVISSETTLRELLVDFMELVSSPTIRHSRRDVGEIGGGDEEG